MVSINQYVDLAEKGDITAQIYLGWAYFSGQGVPEDLVQAEFWLKKAAERKSGEALFYLAKICEKRNDCAEAIINYDKSINEGFWPSCYRIGRLHFLNGDKKKANSYFETGTKNGHLYCMKQYAVSLIYSLNIVNIFKGIYLLIKAAATSYAVFLKHGENDERVRY